MKEIKVKISLPAEVTVNIPSFSEVPLQDVAKAIAGNGVKLIQSIIADRVMEKFVAEHEDYIQDEIERLVEEKRDEIKAILNKD